MPHRRVTLGRNRAGNTVTALLAGVESPVSDNTISNAQLNTDADDDDSEEIWSSPTWPAGAGLAQLILTALDGISDIASDQQSFSNPVRILELGAGLGAASLAAALCGADVLATDGAPGAVDCINASASLNAADIERAGGRLRAAVLDLKKDFATPKEPSVASVDGGAHDASGSGAEAVAVGSAWEALAFQPDVVIAADLLYSRELREYVPRALERLLIGNPSLLCVVSEPGRTGAIEALTGAFASTASAELPVYFDVFEQLPNMASSNDVTEHVVESSTRFVVINNHASVDSPHVPPGVRRINEAAGVEFDAVSPWLRSISRSEMAGIDAVIPPAPPAPSTARPGRSSKVEVRQTGHDKRGRSWFARSNISQGEILYSPYRGHEKLDFKLDQILSWPAARRRAFFKISYQVDDDLYNGYHSETEFPEDVDDIDDYKLDWCLNHSCDPNVWYLDKDLICARRDIACGEELLYDYATTQANEKMDMECHCGASNCRGRIRGDDWSRLDLQFRYGNHFLPYILRKIAAQRLQHSIKQQPEDPLAS